MLLSSMRSRAVPKDLDLWISTDSQNASAIFKALLDFGALLIDMTEDDFAEKAYFYQMGVPPIRIDILIGYFRG
jgi:hypothetical protein